MQSKHTRSVPPRCRFSSVVFFSSALPIATPAFSPRLVPGTTAARARRVPLILENMRQITKRTVYNEITHNNTSTAHHEQHTQTRPTRSDDRESILAQTRNAEHTHICMRCTCMNTSTCTHERTIDTCQTRDTCQDREAHTNTQTCT